MIMTGKVANVKSRWVWVGWVTHKWGNPRIYYRILSENRGYRLLGLKVYHKWTDSTIYTDLGPSVQGLCVS